jgi:HPt (histidine-containing phosphotransfer) domain-containing protein
MKCSEANGMNPSNRPGNAGPLVSELAADPDMSELVEMFVSELPARLKAMSEAMAGANYESLRRLAHQLKGAGGGYGFPSISTAAATLERSLLQSGLNPQGNAQALASIKRELDELVQLCNRARAA